MRGKTHGQVPGLPSAALPASGSRGSSTTSQPFGSPALRRRILRRVTSDKCGSQGANFTAGGCELANQSRKGGESVLVKTEPVAGETPAATEDRDQSASNLLTANSSLRSPSS